MIAGLTLSIFNQQAALGRRISIAWGCGGVALAVLVISAHPVAIIAAAVATGYFVTSSVINTQTYVQLASPDALRGRVLSVHGVVLRASPALGALLAGLAIDRFGLLTPVLICCAVCFGAAVTALLVHRQGTPPLRQ